MINIGIFTHDYYPYKQWGQGRYVFELARHLMVGSDYKIYVFSPSLGIKDDNHIPIFEGSHSTIGKNITFSIKLSFVLERLIKKYKLKLLHFQGGPGGLFVFYKPSVPLIYTVHHTYYQQADFIPGQRWKKILYLLEKRSYKFSDYLVSVSPSTQRILLRHYHVNKNRCEVIPNGVDKKRFFPIEINKIPNSIFFLGRLEKRKGIDYLIKTIPLVKAQIKDIQLFIGGDGILKDDLKSYIKNNQLGENIHFLGMLSDEAVNQWYNRVSIAVIPSIFEGFGLTAIEAMSCGTPVIASNVDGLCDVIEDGVNGMLFEYGNKEDLCGKIVFLLHNEYVQKQLSINGKKCTNEYDWETATKSVIGKYNKYCQ